MKRGSAIIISIFLISAATSVIFGVGRLMFQEISTVPIYEKGIAAYYAAESGIEEGFLRYRYNNENEVPIQEWSLAESSRVYRSNISTGVVETGVNLGGINRTVNLSNNRDQIYDLRMGSQSESYGTLTDLGAGSDSPYYLPRDEARKFKILFPARDIDLAFRPRGNTGGGAATLRNQNCVLLEAKLVGRLTLADSLEEHKAIFGNNTCDYTGLLAAGTYKTYDLQVSGNAVIDNMRAQIWNSGDLAEAELILKPIGADIGFTFADSVDPARYPLYGPYSIIQSYGYYGGVSRRLEAKVDRQSGTLYDLFDYVVYQKE
ncbi:MAG: hypothetical protein AAB360_01110 [Patescibacteria group bacterium]